MNFQLSEQKLITMPPHKPLSSLKDICIQWTLEWISSVVKVCGSHQQHKYQRLYLISALSSNIRQHLLFLTFRQPLYERNLTYKCLVLQLLGDQNTRSVDFSCAGIAYLYEVNYLYRILTQVQITNLTRLGINCNLRTMADKKCLMEVNATFYPVFNKMTNLRWVRLVGVADKTLLTALGMNCPHLEYLYVDESHRVNDEAVAKLLLRDSMDVAFQNIKDFDLQDIPTNPCASSLKVIGLNGTEVSMKSVLTILHCVPYLESFEGDVNVGSLCKIMESLQPEDGHRSFNLQKLWDTRILPNQALLIDRVCPHLTYLSTDASSLFALHLLSSVSSLTLKLYFQNATIEIYNYLLVSGVNLRELVLVDHINCCLDLTWLVELTPNLEHLEATIMKEERRNMSQWPLLTTAKITLESSKPLFALMTHAPILKDLDVTFEAWSGLDTFEDINDTLITNAVASGSLQNLQKLKINKCAISMKGIDCLILNCPDLMYLAPLAFWNGVSHEDLQILHQRTKENNWCFRLVLRVDWEDGQRSSGICHNNDKSALMLACS